MEHLALGSGSEQTSNSTQNVTQLEFTQAMKDFKVMFPAMDEDVIEIVLRANQGAVDATIDQLLQMSGEEGQKNLQVTGRSNEFPPKYTPPPSYNQSIPSSVNQFGWNETDSKVNKEPINKSLIDYQQSKSTTTSTQYLSSSGARPWQLNRKCLAYRLGWNPSLLGPLPADFLRFDTTNSVPTSTSSNIPIPGHVGVTPSVGDAELNAAAAAAGTSPLSSALLQQKMQENERQRLQLASNLDDVEAAQYLEDERIAIFLQNEEFVSELRRNKEFMSALHYDAMRGRNPTSQNSTVNGFCNENYIGDLSGSGHHEQIQHESDADFREKLKNMGKASRRKFAQLAGLFNRRKPAIPSRDNLLLGGDDAYTQLENDCSDTEDHHRRQTDGALRSGAGHK